MSTGHNIISDEHRRVFESLVDRGSFSFEAFSARVTETKLFVQEHKRAPRRNAADDSESQLADWISHALNRGVTLEDEFQSAALLEHLQHAIAPEHIAFCNLRAWCEGNDRWPRESAKDMTERGHALWLANHGRRGRGSLHFEAWIKDELEDLRARFASPAALARQSKRMQDKVVEERERLRQEECAQALQDDEQAAVKTERASLRFPRTLRSVQASLL